MNRTLSRGLSLLILLMPTLFVAQNCTAIVNKTVTAINTQNAMLITEDLTDDFKIAGQEGPIAKMVLNQLLAQLGDPVLRHEFSSSENLDDQLIVKYDFEYESKGPTETTFIFDEHCKIAELILFKMEVKQMCANDASVEKSSKDFIKVPFTLLGNLIQVKVELDGVERNFVVDSGSPKVILNSTYLEKSDTLARKISSSKGVNGSISGVDIHEIDLLDFNGIKMKDQELITMDLSSLEQELEGEIHGLIGYEMIKDYDLLFDYDRLELSMLNPEMADAFIAKQYNGLTQERIPFLLEGHIPVVDADVNGKNVSYGIDCGAEVNLLDDDLFESMQMGLKNIENDTLSGLGGVRKEVNLGEIVNTIFGSVELNDLITVFSDISHINDGYDLQIDGLIGYEVLSSQPTLLSFTRKEMILLVD